MPFRRRRSFSRFSRGRSGTSLRWGASAALGNTVSLLQVTAGGPAAFDLTPGAPSAHWQSGTTEPTLLRIRGFWMPFIQSSVNVSEGGVREQRIAAVLLAWRKAGATTLDPFNTVALASEDIIYSGVIALDTRDFVVPEVGTPVAEQMYVNVAGPGRTMVEVDIKAKRRVRSEDDRLIISARFGEIFSQSTPPLGPQWGDVGGKLAWSLRFLYRTSR